MTVVKTALTGAAVLILNAAAFAQQDQTGVVTLIDRINNTVAIQRTQDGTVGAGAGGPTEQFKTQAGLALDKVHAGDKVSYAVSDNEGTKTLTKLERQSETVVAPPVKQPSPQPR